MAVSWGMEALMFGNLIMLASGFFANSPNSARNVAVRLASFKRSKPGSFSLSINNSGKIEDYPYEFGIVSALLVTLFMVEK